MNDERLSKVCSTAVRLFELFQVRLVRFELKSIVTWRRHLDCEPDGGEPWAVAPLSSPFEAKSRSWARWTVNSPGGLWQAPKRAFASRLLVAGLLAALLSAICPVGIMLAPALAASALLHPWRPEWRLPDRSGLQFPLSGLFVLTAVAAVLLAIIRSPLSQAILALCFSLWIFVCLGLAVVWILQRLRH